MNTHPPNLSACRLLHEQMEKSLSDTQRRLSVKMNELQAAHEQIEALEVRMGECLLHGTTALFVCTSVFEVCSLPTGELSQYGTRHKEEMASLQNTIATLDREKDALQDEVDHKTEKVVVLQEENCRKVHKTSRHLENLLQVDWSLSLQLV